MLAGAQGVCRNTVRCAALVRQLDGRGEGLCILAAAPADVRQPFACLHMPAPLWSQNAGAPVHPQQGLKAVGWLLLLQEMRIVDVPVYDFTTHQRSSETRRVRCCSCCCCLSCCCLLSCSCWCPQDTTCASLSSWLRQVPPADVVIIEGILVLHMEEIREMLNMKVGGGAGQVGGRMQCSNGAGWHCGNWHSTAWGVLIPHWLQWPTAASAVVTCASYPSISSGVCGHRRRCAAGAAVSMLRCFGL